MVAATPEAKARKRQYDRERRRRICNIPPEKFKIVRQTLNGSGELVSEVRVHPGRPDTEVARVVEPAFIARTSTLYGAGGEVRAQWVIEKPEDRDRLLLWQEMATALAAPLPKALSAPQPLGLLNNDLMSLYPVGDHHFGLLSWAKETGEDYDIDIAEKLLIGATERLISLAPNSKRAGIIFLGDQLHFDSYSPVTPASRNLLDSDTRFPKIVGVVMRVMRTMIVKALEKHAEVLVIVVPGNHDPVSSIFLQIALANIYENEPRVTIDTSPSGFHYFEHGKVLIGAYHGHDVKMDKLPIIMATDRPESWGRTSYRYWYTGHIHHAKTQVHNGAQDYQGCTVESFRVLAAGDAWSHSKGYRALRDMKLIVQHREFGEVERHTCNPRMMAVSS